MTTEESIGSAGDTTLPSLADAGGRAAPSVRALQVGDSLLLVIPGVIWGASFLFIAEGLRAIAPMGVTFVRILVGFLTLSLVPAARRPLARDAWPGVALLGVLWLAFPLSMFPFVASLLARRAPSRAVTVGLAVGLTGAVLVGLPTIHEGRSSLLGVALILAALLSYGFALNLARPLQQRHGALPVIWRAQAVALVLTSPLGVPDLLVAHWTPGPLVSLLALGAFGTGVAYVVLAVAAGRVGATRASATTLLIPPVALVLGVVVRGERVALLSVLGGAVCVAGAWLIRRAQMEDAGR
jgi:drug/metabolite transporter (DMT)-like permease